MMVIRVYIGHNKISMKKYIVILFASLSVIAGVVAWYVLGQQADELGEGEVIGQLSEKMNEVKYKHQNGFFYKEAKQGLSLYEQSEVLTGSSSSSEVVLNNSVKLEVPEETLIKVSLKKGDGAGDLVLDILSGKVKISDGGKTGGNLILSSPRGEVKLQVNSGSKVLVDETVDDGTGATFTVLAGSAQLKSGEESISLGMSESVSLKKAAEGEESTGSIFKEKEKALLLPELPNTTSTIYRMQRINFKWKSENNNNLMVQISKEPSFIKTFKSFDVGAFTDFFIASDDFEPGDYYWRLEKKTDSGNFLYSEVMPFSILSPGKTVLLKPKRTFVSRGEWSLEMAVQKAPAQKKYHFQLARDNAFTQVFDEYEGSSPMKSYIDSNGAFFARAREKLGDSDYGPWSDIETDVVRPPLENLASEIEGQVFNKKTGVTTVNLKWAPVLNASEYVIQLSKSPQFNKIEAIYRTQQVSYTLNNSFSEPAYIRILPTSKEGEVGPTKNIFKTKGVLVPPLPEKKEARGAVLDEPGSSPQLYLQWNHKQGFSKYIIEISRNEDMIKSEKIETDNIEYFHKINQEGWYYIRLSGSPTSDQYYVSDGPVFALQYVKPGPLLQTKKFQPKDNEVFIFPPNVTTSIRFSWQEIPAADWYILELSKTDNFKSSKIYKATVPEFLLKDRLPSGRWFYRIKARNKYQEAPWNSLGVFYIGS